MHPTYVVFSAGSNASYHHPRATAAARFLTAEGAEVDKDNIFRTDRGDNEGAPEWVYGAFRGCEDPVGDDDIDIWMPDTAGEPIRIEYRNASRRCRSS